MTQRQRSIALIKSRVEDQNSLAVPFVFLYATDTLIKNLFAFIRGPARLLQLELELDRRAMDYPILLQLVLFN